MLRTMILEHTRLLASRADSTARIKPVVPNGGLLRPVRHVSAAPAAEPDLVTQRALAARVLEAGEDRLKLRHGHARGGQADLVAEAAVDQAEERLGGAGQ